MPAPRKSKTQPQSDDTISVGSGVTVRERRLTDYRHDQRNANRGSERGRAILEQSLKEDGAGRSLIADADDTLIGGNQTSAVAAGVGLQRVIEIETGGDVLIVHKRRDVTLDKDDGKARRMAYRDNRSRDTAEYDPSIVAADAAAGLLDDLLFRADELDDLMQQASADASVALAEVESASGRKTIDENRARVVRIAVFAKQVQVIERAIAAAQRVTGIENRADLLEHIAQTFIDQVGKEVKA